MKTREREKENRDSILIILLILLFGFFCIILASGWAVRFAPSWKLPANMRSNINPDDRYRTGGPVNFIEPLDPAILTNPAWINIFLTPGASFETPTSQPTGISTVIVPSNTNTPNPTSTALPIQTNTAVTIPSRTNVPPPFPTRTFTPIPQPQPTFTPSNTPIPAANLRIRKNDGVTTYNPGGVLTYTITARNLGPSAVTGAVITDNVSAQIASWTWACTSQNGGATGCDPLAGSSANFSDTVNLPNGASIVYTVTANISAGATGNLVNTANINIPAGYTDPVPGNNSATDTDTPASADLGITKTDNASNYDANIPVQYIIVASNPAGPSAVTGATVTDTFSANLTGITWTCTASGGASCTANGSGNINDTVNLPVGGSVQYTVNATVIASPSGDLVNTATVNVPAGITDPNPSDNSATDTDQLVSFICFSPPPPSPYENIGTSPDTFSSNLIPGVLTLRFCAPPLLVVGSHAGYDLVYYPEYPPILPIPPTVLEMDLVILEIGDGKNWYTILYWGNPPVWDGNTDIPGFPPNSTDCTGEPDNCPIDVALLNISSPYPGISIDLDNITLAIPPGVYPYIRIRSLPDSGDGLDVDAITVIFP